MLLKSSMQPCLKSHLTLSRKLTNRNLSRSSANSYQRPQLETSTFLPFLAGTLHQHIAMWTLNWMLSMQAFPQRTETIFLWFVRPRSLPTGPSNPLLTRGHWLNFRYSIHPRRPFQPQHRPVRAQGQWQCRFGTILAILPDRIALHSQCQTQPLFHR